MIAGVADTHAALWYPFGDSRLSAYAKTFIDQAASSGQKVILSVISLAEILYLIDKNRLPFSAYDKLRQALGVVDYVIDEAPLTTGIVDGMRKVCERMFPTCPTALWPRQRSTTEFPSSAATAAFALLTFRLCGNRPASTS